MKLSVRFELKSCLIWILLLFSGVGFKSIYGFERGPIVIADTRPPGVYVATPLQACEYWASLRDIEYVGIPSSRTAEIRGMWVIPWGRDQNNNFSMNILPAIHYQCGVIIHHYGNPPNVPPYEYEWRFGGAFPVCNVGDWPYVPSDKICTAPDNIPDPGANSGHPQLCIGNPINVATGNKYDQQTDFAYSTGLAFSRYYNAAALSDSRQMGASWRHTFQRGLYINSATVSAIRADGKLIYFRLADDAFWINQQKGYELLIQIIDSNDNITGWQLITDDDATEYYDTTGKLLSITDRSGRSQLLTYDLTPEEGGDGDPETLDSVTDGMGRQLAFSYDVQKRVATLRDPAGGLYRYNYDAYGNLVSVTYPDGGVRSYHYNEPAYTSGANLPSALTGVTDENGARFATYHYDAQGRAIATEHAGATDRHQLAYNPDGSTTVTDPLGTQRTYQFQTVLGVAKSAGQSQPGGAGCGPASSATTYDDNGNVSSQIDFNGNKTCYAYDLARNLEIARIEGLSTNQTCPTDLANYTPVVNTAERKILTDWHSTFRLPARITEAERETVLNYDHHGNITRFNVRDRETHANRGWTANYAYHPDVPGVVMQSVVDGPRTDVQDITTIDYYAPDIDCDDHHYGCRGQIKQITNALGHVTQIARYNAHGRPEAIIDPNGLVTTLVYDVRQRLLSRTQGTETTRYDYDAAGQLIKLTAPDGSAIHYRYDAAHRLIQIADNLGNRIEYTLDSMGQRVREEVFDPANTLIQARQREFDALGRLWKAIGAHDQVTELGYDANGNLKQSRNPLAHITTHHFDTLDRLIRIHDPAGGQSRQEYDALDRVASITDPKGMTTHYTYNGLGDQVREVSADRGTTTYAYDAAGNLTTRTDARGVVETTAYDALNRPVSRSYQAASGVSPTNPVTWHYDEGLYGTGHLTRVQDESGTTTYQYDPHGRLLSKTQAIHSGKEIVTQTLGYQYDSNGRLVQTTYPSGARITVLYGDDGRPVEMRVNDQALIRNIVYQPFGGPKSWIWGHGPSHDRHFDLDGRLIQHVLGEGMQSLSYDPASRITQTLHTNPIFNRSYNYDALDRLTHQLTSSSHYQWQYDANGNRISVQPGSMVYPYTLDTTSNRLLTVAGPMKKHYAYDAAGNPLTDGLIHYTWNTANRLAEVALKRGKVVYRYNGHGERVVKTGDTRSRLGTTFFFYDEAGRLVGDYEGRRGSKKQGNWLVKQETVWLGEIPIAVLKMTAKTNAIEIFPIHTDHLNTPRVIVDQKTDLPIWRWDNIDAFGANLPDEDPDQNRKSFEYNLRFAGQYFDKETQLHYNYFRDYDPNTGRYLQSDPIGLAGGLNPYGYVFNNPLQYTDPTGEAVPAIALWMVGGALSLLDMLSPPQPHPDYPDAIESVWTVPGPVGGAKRACGVGEGVAKFSPINPGPLAYDIAKTFRSATYSQRILSNDTTLFRVISDNGNPTGSFWTSTKPQGPLQSVIDSALDQNWGNTATRVVTAKLPSGTTIYEGAAAAQRGLVGGGSQIYIPRVDLKWIQ
jgi:RHS repeat-associated protein